MPDSHSKFAASNAHRWIRCSKTVTEGARLEDPPSNIHSIEGTAAHLFAEKCHKYGWNPKEFLGRMLKGDIFINAELAEAVKTYLDYIYKQTEGVKKNRQFREGKFLIDSISKDIGGTVDFCYLHGELVEVIDFKYGKNVYVSPKDNWQLIIYALAALDALKSWAQDVEIVRLTIVQPRCHGDEGPIRSYEYRRSQMDEYYKTIRKAYDRVNLCPNDASIGEWCQWCKVEATCSAQYKEAEALAKTEFNAISDVYVASIIEKAPIIRKYLKAVEDYARRRVIDERRSIAGLKIVRGRGKRRYKGGDEKALQSLLSRGFKIDGVTTPRELLPLTKLEKLIGKDIVSELVERQEGAPIVVPSSDKRDEYCPDPDFEKVGE